MRRLFAPESLIPLVLAALVFVPSTGTHALDESKVGPIAKPGNEAYQKGAAEQKSRVGSALINEEEASEKAPIAGEAPPVRNHFEFKVPPMAGFQQIAGMKSMKEMLKRLITADVPVMFQTMMMVENGAATGYMGSMNTVGSLLSNTIQTSQLQMQMFDALEAGGKKGAYVLEAYDSMVNENKDSWPAALWWASGDRVQGTPKPIEDVKDNTESPTGSSEATLKKAEEELAAGGSSGEKKEVLLSELLFTSSAGSSPGAAYTVADLKDGMLNWVGDLKIVTQKTGEHSTLVKPEFIEAREFERASSSSGSGLEDEPGSVYDLLVKQTTLEVWKHLNAVMRQYCEFKQNTENYTKDIFEKKRPSSAIEDDDWKKIHSLDIKPSINLVDQLFKLFVGRRNIQEIKCNSFKGDKDTLPESGNPTTASGTIFDSCDDNPKQCLRNVVLYRITKFISVSQVNYFYRWMWEQIYVRTKDDAEQEYLTDLFCTNAQLGWPCDPGTEFSTRIDMNRVAWVEFSNKLSRFAQGQGGSAIFRPSSDNSTLGAAGSVAMGSGATNGGGGK